MCRHDDMPERTLVEPDPHAYDEPPGEYEHEDEQETPCPNRDDKMHCNCWYDGDMCCACGASGMTDDEKRKAGMDCSRKDPLESGVDLVETLWLIGTGKTLKEWTTK